MTKKTYIQPVMTVVQLQHQRTPDQRLVSTQHGNVVLKLKRVCQNRHILFVRKAHVLSPAVTWWSKWSWSFWSKSIFGK